MTKGFRSLPTKIKKKKEDTAAKKSSLEKNRTPTKMHDVTVESNIKTTPSTVTKGVFGYHLFTEIKNLLLKTP